MIVPRPYQEECISAILNRLTQGVTCQLVALPTGCGKTVIFALLAKEMNTRTLVIAHTQELITQAVSKFKIVWPNVDIGIVKADSDEVSAQVVVASIQTASRPNRLQKLKEQGFGLMVIDEAHHAAASSYTNVIQELVFSGEASVKILVGVTATPKRGDGVGLKGIFQEVVFERSISTMIRAGYLAPLVGKQVFTKVRLANVGVRNGDFIRSELSRRVNTPDRNQLIIDNYKQYAADRSKTLAFCVDVQHAKDLAEVFNRNGIGAKAVYGSMDNKERLKTLADFSKGEFNVLTNCQLLTEGFDEPSINCVIMGRPTKSSSLFTQMVGRGTRTFPQKNNCLILDFCDNASRNVLCSYKNTLDGIVAPLIDSGCAGEAEEYVESCNATGSDYRGVDELRVYQERIEDIKFFDRSLFAWIQVGDAWHLSLARGRDVWVRPSDAGYRVVAHVDGQIIDLSNRELPLGYSLGIGEDFARSLAGTWGRKDAFWRGAKPTPKQIDLLKNMGIPLDISGYTRGQVYEILDQKLHEKFDKNIVPATDKQLWKMRQLGIEFSEGISKREAWKRIQEAMTSA